MAWTAWVFYFLTWGLEPVIARNDFCTHSPFAISLLHFCAPQFGYRAFLSWFVLWYHYLWDTQQVFLTEKLRGNRFENEFAHYRHNTGAEKKYWLQQLCLPVIVSLFEISLMVNHLNFRYDVRNKRSRYSFLLRFFWIVVLKLTVLSLLKEVNLYSIGHNLHFLKLPVIFKVEIDKYPTTTSINLVRTEFKLKYCIFPSLY